MIICSPLRARGARAWLLAAALAPAALTVRAQNAPPSPAAAPAAVAAEPMPRAGSAAAGRRDQLELETTSITGNAELPKVLYILPWKRSGTGELPQKPDSALMDEALAPVDRMEFRRELRYRDAAADAPH